MNPCASLHKATRFRNQKKHSPLQCEVQDSLWQWILSICDWWAFSSTKFQPAFTTCTMFQTVFHCLWCHQFSKNDDLLVSHRPLQSDDLFSCRLVTTVGR